MNTYKGKNLPYLLVSAPVDIEFEMLVMACTINLLKGLMTTRFKTPLDKDRELLSDPNLPIRNRFAVLHRMNAKDILTENINYCNILMRILARFGTAGQVLEPKDFKEKYMQLVEGGYETEEELMRNRIRIRRYLRELIINQKRVLSAALDKEYVEKVKEYFDNKKKEEDENAEKQAKKAIEEEEEDEEEDEEEGEDDEDEDDK